MSLGRRLFSFLCAGVGGLALAACSTADTGFREAVGLDRAPPDEFLVVSKAPLVVPPDMNLRPPAPGALPLNAEDPRVVAQSTITGSTTSAGAGATAGEQSILARAGASGADPNVRADLLREQGIATKDQSLVDRLATARRNEEELLDPYAEAQRMQTAGGTQTATGSTAGTPTAIVLEDILGGSASTN